MDAKKVVARRNHTTTTNNNKKRRLTVIGDGLIQRKKCLEVHDILQEMGRTSADFEHYFLQNENGKFQLTERFMSDLRELPLCLQKKKKLLDELKKMRKSILSSIHEESVDTSEKCKEGFKHFWKAVKGTGKSVFSPIERIILSLKQSYGQNMASYFYYLKWLLIANIFALFILLPIIVPHILILVNDYNKPGTNYSICLNEKPDATLSSQYLKFKFEDIFLAKSAIQVIFYGCFSGDSFRFPTKHYYNMSYAYLLTIVAFFIYWLVKSSSGFSSSIGKYFIRSQLILKETSFFSNIVFTDWDYSLRTVDAVESKKNQIYREIKDNFDILDKKEINKEHLKNSWVYLLFSNLLYLMICAMNSAMIYFIYIELHSYEYKHVIFSVAVCLTNYGVPFFFDLLSYVETLPDKSRAALLKFIRMFIFQSITIVTAIVTLLIAAEKYNEQCYETTIGKLFYTMILIDLLFYFLDMIYAVFSSVVLKKDYDITYYTFNAMFSQALVWIGTYYSPFFTIMQIVKLLIIFFFELLIVKMLYKPSKQIWPASKNQAAFLGATFIAFLLVTIGIGYLGYQHTASKNCGPFQDALYATTFDYFSRILNELQQTYRTFSIVLSFLVSPGIVAFLLFIFSVSLFTSYVAMSGYKQSVKLLKIMHEDQKQIRKSLSAKKQFYDNELKSMKKTQGVIIVDVEEDEDEEQTEESFIDTHRSVESSSAEQEDIEEIKSVSEVKHRVRNVKETKQLKKQKKEDANEDESDQDDDTSETETETERSNKHAKINPKHNVKNQNNKKEKQEYKMTKIQKVANKDDSEETDESEHESKKRYKNHKETEKVNKAKKEKEDDGKKRNYKKKNERL